MKHSETPGPNRSKSPEPKRFKGDYQSPLKPGEALQFELQGTDGRARAGVVHLPHGPVKTPVFMPVGTYGTIKGLLSEEVDELGPEIILANTYHLGTSPGAGVLQKVGGLHEYMHWPRNLLTDSGGFQMVSLLKLLSISEEGVHFQNPRTKEMMMLTPEESMGIQNSIGADIMMALDDVVSSTYEDRDRMKDAVERTIRWLDRCIAAHKRPEEQNLFGIVQGGLDRELRSWCLAEIKKRKLPGYAIGGLSGGEAKESFWQVVEQCTAQPEGLPADRPRYLMGVGYTLDIICCVALGVDMFDCVYPTRTARFGTALVRSGQMRLNRSDYRLDLKPIDPECSCPTCKNGYTRAYLHSIAAKEPVCAKLITVHNIHYMLTLLRECRAAILDKRFSQFVRDFLAQMYPSNSSICPPGWCRRCLSKAGIDITDMYDWSACTEGRDMPVSEITAKAAVDHQ
ncbi:Queuine tRNA-ribosyltransferase catalytic subunit 1 [Perkinsus olseni]|uniref:Queuine tRNA-ribosyltransferase catalytic subunit 1 n=1 Tax=Perkinsus olseni TaxID=32597 RepID=A0A7J6KTW9_PEROL|nr:Queuine tRNA-ribosyltransferase catalytic subunit 1 [Perkinsus olseni]